ncbi:MAG: response regulator [Saprospiraceae bacterium]
MEKIKIAIFEDDPEFREGLVWLLATEPRFEVVGQFPNAQKILENLASAKPQIVLLDVTMPGGVDGVAAMRLIRENSPEILVIMLTAHDEEDIIFGAIRAGASGYLLKSRAAAELRDAIFSTLDGGSPMTPQVAKKVLSFFAEPQKTQVSTPENQLSKRETEILRSLTKGFSYKMTAAEHHIAVDTVRSHLRKIYEKLQVHSMSEAVAVALTNRLV